MILTGKAKEDFENWVHKTHDDNFDGSYGKRLFYISSLDDYKFIETDHYIYNIGGSMLNALIVEWFDSVGIYVNAIMYNKHYFQPYCNNLIHEKYENRQEAIEKAIEHANKIYNETKV